MQAAVSDEQSTYTVLVTGANSGLGYATCCRLMTEFLKTRPQCQTLHLIVTTRDQRKADDTLRRLREHVQTVLRDANSRLTGISALLEPRIQLSSELLDLCSLVSVKRLSQRLIKRGKDIDVLILNAGIGGWSGMNWPRAIWSIITDWREATTYPTYKLGYTGRVSAQQQQTVAVTGDDASENNTPVLGETFAANVFGHYILAHELVPLMTRTRAESMQTDEDAQHARIIWVSSLEAYAHAFSPDDLQSLRTSESYESTKRLTDLLVLTSELPSTHASTSTYLSPSAPTPNNTPITPAALPPKMYLSHPGICGTSIAALNPLLEFFRQFSFYISRLLGSPWHTIHAYLGACAPVWLALTDQRDLDVYEAQGRKKGKWGSSADMLGKERVVLTEVEGWGWRGQVGERADGGLKLRKQKARWRGMGDVTMEQREDFEVLGASVWREMEELRAEWEGRLEGVAGLLGDGGEEGQHI
ncbi:hypothetical protein AAFC00_004751 [Neodothiora populina]|uniref:3-keto-steroid reductase n=1 Tax=Neodothiora populina TaxID=2781224 RepID=A0ABR3P317_9PEZI